MKLFCESTIQSCHENGLAPKGSKTGAVRTLKIEYAASGHKEDGVAERPMEWCKSTA